MSDIELIIKIDEDYYEIIKHDVKNGMDYLPCRVIANAIPLHKGHWIIHPTGIYTHLICDQCLSAAPYDIRTNFCPNCGAKMTESEE